MASTDHTADARPPVRNEPHSSPDPFIDRSSHPMSFGLDKLETYGAKRAGIALAVGTLRGVLESSETFRCHMLSGRRDLRAPWPLNPVHTTGLNAAVYFLQQYADTLDPEPGG